MAKKLKIKKGDRVVAIAGKDKGRSGEVLRVLRQDDRVIVQGLNMIKRHQKPSQLGPGGIEEREAAIHISNVALMDPKDVARAVAFMGSLPLDSNVQTLTIMATKMPFVGRG